MTILVTCTSCSTDNRVEAVHMVVRFSDDRDERAAELLFACAGCGALPVQRVPKELAAVVVFRGAASLTAPDELPALAPEPVPAQDPAALTLDDLLDLHLLLENGDGLRCLLEDPGPHSR